MNAEAIEVIHEIMGEMMTTMFSREKPRKDLPPAVKEAPPLPPHPPVVQAVVDSWKSPTIMAARDKREAVVIARNKLNLEIEAYDRAIRFLEEHLEAPKIFRFLIDQGIAVPVEK